MLIPGGRIQFDNDQLSVTGFSMVVEDEYGDDRSTLTVAGGVKLKDFVPQKWALHIDGQLAGKMLLVLAPRVFSAATGSSTLSLALHGEGPTPDIDGTIDFRRTDSTQHHAPRISARDQADRGLVALYRPAHRARSRGRVDRRRG